MTPLGPGGTPPSSPPGAELTSLELGSFGAAPMTRLSPLLLLLSIACSRPDSGTNSLAGSPAESRAREAAGDPAATEAERHDPPAPIEVRDARGQLVRLARRPTRVVSVLPALTESVAALGAAEQIVAIDGFGRVPASLADKPHLGLEPSVEAILLLEPDLVLCSRYGTLATSLEQAGLRVFADAADTYEDVFRSLDDLGHLLQRAGEARAVSARLRARVAALRARVPAGPPLRVYFEVDATPYSVGPQSFIGELIAHAGGQTVVPAALGAFPQVSPEAIIEWDPEVIVGMDLEQARQRPGWDAITAVREGRVHPLRGDTRDAIVRPSPQLDLGLEALIAILHPELEGELNGALDPELDPARGAGSEAE